jgi:hypothetical protein
MSPERRIKFHGYAICLDRDWRWWVLIEMERGGAVIERKEAFIFV